MKLFKKIAIIGVGLIGGSIGLAIKKRKLAGEVAGVFRRTSTMRRALKCKAVDLATLDIEAGVRGADLVVIATPVSLIPKTLKRITPFLKSGAIVTDVGSVKGWVVKECEDLIRKSNISFVGSHPMAGSERTGVENARPDIFKDSIVFVTKTEDTDPAALKKVVTFWKALNSSPEVMSPNRHDMYVAQISHHPHLVAFSLAGSVPMAALKFTGSGFKDTTRIAASDADLWADILVRNKKAVLKSVSSFKKFYSAVLKALKRGDERQISKLLLSAKLRRELIRHE